MSKRGAAVQLTDSNWDAEDDCEEAGHFKVAGKDQLSKRVMKKAKRRAPGESDTSNSFKGFQGFGNSSAQSMNKGLSITSTTEFKGFGIPPKKTDAIPGKVNGLDTDMKTQDKNEAYMAEIKRLNQDVSAWIKKHITQNPYVDLSPGFKDYEKHWCNLEKKYPAAPSNDCLEKIVTAQTSGSSGSPVTNGTINHPFTLVPSAQLTSDAAEPNDEPKIQSEVKSKPEKDAFYSIRCKLFFKRESEWAELGVGMLNLKKISDSRIQAIVRNDTALSKIILNVVLNESTPTSRSGKNNVLLVSVPNPPVFGKEGDNTKPVSYLIRVKTAANADELHENMKIS